MHPCEEKKRWLQGIIDPPSYTLSTVTIEYEYIQRSIMNVACDYEAPMQMLTTEKYIAPRPRASPFFDRTDLFRGRSFKIVIYSYVS